MNLEQDLQQRASVLNATVVLADAHDPRVTDAAFYLNRHGICRTILVDANTPADHKALQHHLIERRASKGLSLEEATRYSHDPLFIAAWMIHNGEADSGVAGAASATSDVLRAGLWTIGTAEDVSTVSSFFLMVWQHNHQTLTYADCGVVPNPSAEQLADIAFSAAMNHKLLTHNEPRVAFLSYSTKGSAQHEMVDKVRSAFEIFSAKHSEIIADGELQVDAAIVPLVAHRKAPDSPVSGMANVLIFPNLDAGNIAYKLTERLAAAQAFGPIVQGLQKPFADLSRGCTAADIVNVACISIIQSAPLAVGQ
ncbi:MAG: phosphate acetyltransferase [Ignavibacteria bacterium]|nr:phosphate acetyltransferase [Ignavibacteria bacterium]